MSESSLPQEPLEAGWEALRQGRWGEARTAFERAIGREPSAAAFEGLSWAAWWLDDAVAVFDARERAFSLYREAGDRPSAARMATWIASDHLDFNGTPAIAQGWLRRANRLLTDLPPEPAHGWVAFLEGYLAHVAGETDRARRLAREASDLGRRFAAVDLEMLGLALEGSVCVADGEVAEGMGCLDEATTIALGDEATIPISGAWTCCFLVTACSTVRDYQRASEWCDRIAEFAERYGSRYMLAFCRAEYGAVHLWRGEWAEAERMLEAAIEDFAMSRPAMVAGTIVSLAELRGRQGRDDAALELLERAGATARAQLCRAMLALDAGDAGRAAKLAERFLRQAGHGHRMERAPALEVLVAAQVEQGDLEAADRAVVELALLARSAGTPALRALAALAEGRLAAGRGEHERGRTLLEDSVDGLERAGSPFEAGRARVELARTLLALGLPDDARAEADAALSAFEELGAATAREQARRVIAACGSARSDSSLSPLTPREREVVELLAEGLTNREIADRLTVSEHTVHRHVTNVLRKLDLPSRTAVAVYATRVGLADEPRA